jgi:RNA polymerase sigma-70 factor (ECF subfamily)
MNPKDWPQVVRDHAALVSQTAYRLLGNQADAADCFQETFAGAWEIARRQPIRNWPALLQRLATARALDQLRRRRTRANHFSAAPQLGDMASGDDGPLADALRVELAGQLRRALADLPARQSECYCLRHLNDMSYEQIAAALNMSVSAVGVTLHRAAERLRAALTHVMSERIDSR